MDARAAVRHNKDPVKAAMDEAALCSEMAAIARTIDVVRKVPETKRITKPVNAHTSVI